MNRIVVHPVEKPVLCRQLQDSILRVREAMPSRVLFIVNNRKFLLSRIYSCLQDVLGQDRVKTIAEVNSIPAGAFTNPQCKDFCEPEHVVMILTKNHHLKEKRVIRELRMARIPLTILMLGCVEDALPRENLLVVPNVRTLYHLMYNMCALDATPAYQQFIARFALVQREDD